MTARSVASEKAGRAGTGRLVGMSGKRLPTVSTGRCSAATAAEAAASAMR